MGLVQDGTTAFSYSVRPGKLQLTWIQVSNTRGFSGLGRLWVLDGLTVHRFLFSPLNRRSAHGVGFASGPQGPKDRAYEKDSRFRAQGLALGKLCDRILSQKMDWFQWVTSSFSDLRLPL